jgi:hypothetical protein
MKLAFLAIVLLAACDAQVDAEYPGEPVARVHGTAVGFSPEDVADGAGVRWNTQQGVDLTAGPVTLLPFEATPPAGVTVLVLAAPPEEAYFGFDDGSPRIAEGALFLTRGDDRVGVTIDTALVFVDGEVPLGSLAALYLGGMPVPGFHLYDERATAVLSEPQAYFAMRCGGGEACTQPRLYQLVPTADDLATTVPFFRSSP